MPAVKEAIEIAVITFRVPMPEKLQLESFCTATGRTQTDVLREFIRSLKVES